MFRRVCLIVLVSAPALLTGCVGTQAVKPVVKPAFIPNFLPSVELDPVESAVEAPQAVMTPEQAYEDDIPGC